MPFMKRKFALFNLILMAVVLCTTAWQSFHAFSHKHLSEVHSHEEHYDIKKSGTQLSISDSDHEDCSICDFHFDFFTAPQQFCLRLDFSFNAIPFTIIYPESTTWFSGSLFALRAPPVLV